jgi:hypothetical protein
MRRLRESGIITKARTIATHVGTMLPALARDRPPCRDDRSASGAYRSVWMTHRTRCGSHRRLCRGERTERRRPSFRVNRRGAPVNRRLQCSVRECDQPRNRGAPLQNEPDRTTQADRNVPRDRRTAAALIRHLPMHDRHAPMCECHLAARYRAQSGVTADMKGNEARRFADRTTQ